MKRLLRVAAVALALVVLAVVAISLLVDADRYRPSLEARLTQALKREVKLGRLSLHLLQGGISASDISIADDPAYGGAPFIQAKSLKIGVELWPLIASRQVRVTALNIDQPAVALIQSPSGEWNFSSLGGRSPGKPKVATPSASSRLDLSVNLVKIAGGRFTLGKKGTRSAPLIVEDVNLELRDFSSDSSFPFTLSAKAAGGGSIKLTGQAGPLSATDIAGSPFSASLNVSKLATANGVVSFEGVGNSNGSIAQLKGRFEVERLKLAPSGTPAARPVEFEFAGDHNLRKGSGHLQQGAIHIGSAPAVLAGSYAEAGDSTVFHMKLVGSEMPVPELAAMLPAMGIALPAGSSLEGGTATVNLTLEGPLDRLVTAGSVSLDKTRLKGFDMGRKMAVIETLAGIKGGPDTEIQAFKTTLRIAPDGIVADPIQLIVPAIGNLEGGGTVSPSNALAFKMRATVHTSGMLGKVGERPIPFFIEGPATNPVFRPDLKGLATQEMKSGATKAAEGLLKGLLGGKKN